jgi:CRP-like cAMP-binding protein/di/tricarboxylate transporter
MTAGSASDPSLPEAPPLPELEDFLTRIPLFAEIDRVALAQLAAHLDPVALAAGDTVCRQGEPGDCLYVVAAGRLGVHLDDPAGGASHRIDGLGPGDFFGEMALLTGEPRSATVIAEAPSRVLRLERERFEMLVRQQPSSFLAIARVLSRRLATANRMRAVEERALGASVDAGLARLPPDRRQAVLEASLLESPADLTDLGTLFADRAGAVATDLADLGVGRGGTVVRDVLRARARREEGPARLRGRAEALAARLAGAGAWDAALSVLAAHADAAALSAMLARALRAVPPLPPDLARGWIERLDDHAVVEDPDLALARATFHEGRGDRGRALEVLRRALGGALRAPSRDDGPRLAREISRLALAAGERPVAGVALRPRVTGEAPTPRRSGWPSRLCLVVAAALALGAAWPGVPPGRRFVTLLLAAIVAMLSRSLPDFAVGLGLVAAWILLGVARPAEALAGLASREWLFMIAVYGLAAATARSGLLFRIGLLLVKSVPTGTVRQAVTLLVSGLAVTPLIPSATGRASLVLPLARALAEALRVPDRSGASAVLGLAAWTGAGPLMFVALSGSGTCLLAWGLLPEASRARIGWVQWLVAALPLGAFLGAGALLLLLTLFRPAKVPAPPPERLGLQVALLGPPSVRETAMALILSLTVAGWIAAPWLGLDLATVALLGLLAAAAVGSFDGAALQALDWGMLLFFGVVLSLGRLATALGIDAAAGALIGNALGATRPGPLAMVLVAAVVSALLRLVLEQDLTVLLASLTLIPVATAAGVEPWAVTIALLATSVAWILPFQTSSYLVARAASEDRLFSHEQARRYALAYTGLTLLGLALAVPYWRLLGIL